ncbi:AraC family transcriptional regulator [Catenuloplanes sp. NPDC051500]|uniref:AraC family transcriptional regulator n=1 Tax=Catenuloplanes sp. NPDC051500 TaxID=3363959 RepID=UPI0037B6B8B7
MISDVVATARGGRAVAVRNRYAGVWSTRFPEINGSGLHIVRLGAPWLVPEEGDPVALHPGEIVFVPHGRPHGFGSSPVPFRSLPEVRQPPPADRGCFDVEFVSCCYHLDRGRVHDALSGLPDVITLPIDETLGMLADLLGAHAVDSRPGSDLALPAVVDLILIHLLRRWQDQQGELGVADAGIVRVLRSVREDPHRLWTVQQLSDVAGLSRAALTRRFTSATGEGPGAYLLRRRLDRAAHLLRHTDLPLALIAAQLGYATEFSFSAAFRRAFGIAPGRFRNRERHTTEAT